jgi:hypothetical protein
MMVRLAETGVMEVKEGLEARDNSEEELCQISTLESR